MRISSSQRDVWGILGGMGPLASAEFVKTIYEQNIRSQEQECPIIILLSDPAIPDRTTSLLNGTEEVLLKHVKSGISRLRESGATRIVICCVTIHPVLSQLPLAMQEKIVSLVDVIYSCVLRTNKKYLLLCTEGTRAIGIFERHYLWQDVKDRIVLPDGPDQALIHSLIYDIKRNSRSAQQLNFLETLLQKYEVTSYIAACTELHILAKDHTRSGSSKSAELCIDPLTVIASGMLPHSDIHLDLNVTQQQLS